MSHKELLNQFDTAILDLAAGALAVGVHCGDDEE
ncbi:MAG: hypothetical protein RIT25_2959 [Planctomycetota bacterium]|jgi:hypothetical protein